MDLEIAAATAGAALSVFYYLSVAIATSNNKNNKSRRKRRWWMTTMHRNRTEQCMEKMFTEMLHEPSGEFENFSRMSLADFEFLLHKIGPHIAKKDTDWRKAIPIKIRLAITLRFLATGDSYRSLHYLFKISSQIICKIVPEVCEAINEALKDQVKMPSSAEEWLVKEKGFARKFPHCVRAIDGKHVVIESPVHSGSEYYNYKRSFGIVLLALVDSDYCFMFADIGSQGRISDGGIFRNSSLWENICSGRINLPHSCPESDDENVPYVFIGDGAFALSEYVMKPYSGNHEINTPKRIFNQRLSSSRVVVENVFGIMSSVFRVFKKPMLLQPNTVSKLTMTCVLLHNFLRRSKTSSQFYTPPGTFDSYDDNGKLLRPGSWRHDEEGHHAMPSIRQVARKPPLNAVKIIYHHRQTNDDNCQHFVFSNNKKNVDSYRHLFL